MLVGSRLPPRPTAHGQYTGSSRPTAVCNVQPTAVLQPRAAVQSFQSISHTVLLDKPTFAGHMTPAKLAAFCNLLHMPVKMMEHLLEMNPKLQQVSERQLYERLCQLTVHLGVTPKEAVNMMCKQPTFLLSTDLVKMQQQVHQLAGLLAVPAEHVLEWATATPSVLKRDAESINTRIRRLAEVLGISIRRMIRLASAAPQYLTVSYAATERRFQELTQLLGCTAAVAAVVVCRQPDILFMSSRIINNKVKVLMAILNKQRRHVLTLVIKHPQLLRGDLKEVQATWDFLIKLTCRSEGFVYAMVCHSPGVLLQPVSTLQRKQQRLRRAFHSSPRWREEFLQHKPPVLEEMLSQSLTTYDRLDFLLSQQQAEKISLEETLLSARITFLTRFPDFRAYIRSRDASSRTVAVPAQESRGKHSSRQHGHVASTAVNLSAASALAVTGVAAATAALHWQHRALPIPPSLLQHAAASQGVHIQTTHSASAALPTSEAAALHSQHGSLPAAAHNRRQAHKSPVQQQQQQAHIASTPSLPLPTLATATITHTPDRQPSPVTSQPSATPAGPVRQSLKVYHRTRQRSQAKGHSDFQDSSTTQPNRKRARVSRARISRPPTQSTPHPGLTPVATSSSHLLPSGVASSAAPVSAEQHHRVVSHVDPTEPPSLAHQVNGSSHLASVTKQQRLLLSAAIAASASFADSREAMLDTGVDRSSTSRHSKQELDHSSYSVTSTSSSRNDSQANRVSDSQIENTSSSQSSLELTSSGHDARTLVSAHDMGSTKWQLHSGSYESEHGSIAGTAQGEDSIQIEQLAEALEQLGATQLVTARVKVKGAVDSGKASDLLLSTAGGLAAKR